MSLYIESGPTDVIGYQVRNTYGVWVGVGVEVEGGGQASE